MRNKCCSIYVRVYNYPAKSLFLCIRAQETAAEIVNRFNFVWLPILADYLLMWDVKEHIPTAVYQKQDT